MYLLVVVCMQELLQQEKIFGLQKKNGKNQAQNALKDCLTQ